MINIFNIVTAQNIKYIWDERAQNRPPYIGELFFPRNKQLGLEFSTLKGRRGAPVELVASSFDSKVLYRDRIGLELANGKLPYFKEAYKTPEELMMKIATLQEIYANQLIPMVFDDVYDLLLSAEVTAERMRMQLLSQGVITIQANGVDKEYDYGFDSVNQLKTETKLWSATDASPFKTLITQIRNYKKLTKKDAKAILMSDTLFTYLTTDTTLLDVFAKMSVPNPAPTDAEILSYLEKKFNVTFIINDKVYRKARDFEGVDVHFYPEDRFTILPDMPLGETLYGTTPEEIDLTTGQSNALSATLIDNVVTITTWKEPDPVVEVVKASEVVAPTCPYIEYIYIVKVL